MRKMQRVMVAIVSVLMLALVSASSAWGQVGKGLLDANVASEAELRALPHMTPAIVTNLIAKRPFMSVLELNAFLLGERLTAAQAAEFYGKAFVHVNLNTGTREEILLIPGAGARMAREFDEYRPWVNWAQFDREISKYVGQPETDRLKQYVFIPINLNTASAEVLMTVPGAGQRMVHEFEEYRPWRTKEQFDREIGKYVGAKETARFWRYFVIQ
jgi:DNA uptake protein ComE-like DNA-binding protein